MTIQSLLVSLLVLALAGCGSDSSGSDATASDSPTAEELAAIQQAELAAGGTGSAEALVISARTYTSGSVRAKVTGFFEADGTQEINRPASITDDDQTWIQYGVSGAQELNVLFTNSTAMAENGVNIGIGPYTVTATSTSGECRTKVDVTPTLVSGRYSCTGTTAYNNQTGQMGEVDIEIEFSAIS
jgi:hypothetical protein